MVCHCRYYFRFGSRGERGGGENYTSIILIGIVVIFFICHTPRNIMNWYDFISVESALFCQANNKSHFPPYWIYFLFMLGESLVVLNSSINFFLYYFVGQKFRRELFQIFGNGFSRAGLSYFSNHENHENENFEVCVFTVGEI